MAGSGTRELRKLRKVLILPSLAELPPDVEVQALPFLGHSWYRRGFGYWMRRAFASSIFFLLPLMNILVILALIRAVTREAMPFYAIGLCCLAVGAVGSASYCYPMLGASCLRQVYLVKSPTLIGQAPVGRVARVSGGTAAMSFLTGGFSIALLLRTFAPMMDQEIVARARLLDAIYLSRKEAARVEGLRKRHPHEYEEAIFALGTRGPANYRWLNRSARPPEWRSVRVAGLPTGVWLLSLPLIGTTWYERGPAYRRARQKASAVFAALGLVYALIWCRVVVAVWRVTDGSFVGWLVIAAVLVLGGYGVVVGFFDRELHWLLKLALKFATPGWLLGYALRVGFWPQLDGEDLARADVEAQLAAASSSPGTQKKSVNRKK